MSQFLVNSGARPPAALTARMIKRGDVRRGFALADAVDPGEMLVRALVPKRLRVLLATRNVQMFITTYTFAFGFFSVWLA